MHKIKFDIGIIGAAIGIIILIILLFVIKAKPKRITIFGVEFELPTATLLNTQIQPSQTPTRLSPEPINIVESPQQFIQDYYNRINSRQYDKTWLMLSENYRAERNPTGIQDYKDWWNSFEKVELVSIEIHEQTDYTAKITVTLFYTYLDGSTLTDLSTYDLVFDGAKESWLIDR